MIKYLGMHHNYDSKSKTFRVSYSFNINDKIIDISIALPCEESFNIAIEIDKLMLKDMRYIAIMGLVFNKLNAERKEKEYDRNK